MLVILLVTRCLLEFGGLLFLISMPISSFDFFEIVILCNNFMELKQRFLLLVHECVQEKAKAGLKVEMANGTIALNRLSSNLLGCSLDGDAIPQYFILLSEGGLGRRR